MKLTFDTISFFIGVLITTIFWWLIWILKPIINHYFSEIKKSIHLNARAEKINRTETEYRRLLYYKTQGMHLTSSIFSLDEIYIPSRFLAPPIVTTPGSANPQQDIVEQTIPYMLKCPQLGAFYNAPSLSLSDALAIDMNLVIIGQPGSGKSSALNFLASTLVNPASIGTQPLQIIPFLTHAADLPTPLVRSKKVEDLLAPIIQTIQSSINKFKLSNFSKFTLNAFTSGKALLLIDGIDEMPLAGVQMASKYISMLLETFPKIKIITTGSPECLGGLLNLDFYPLAIMPWSHEEQSKFLNIWTDHWQKISREQNDSNFFATQNVKLLNRWIASENIDLTPLEFTLKVWGAYAGDIRTAQIKDLIEATINRFIPRNLSLEDVAKLALMATRNETPFFTAQQGSSWLKAHTNIPEIQTDIANSTKDNPQTPKGIVSSPKQNRSKHKNQLHYQAKSSFLPALHNSGILIQHSSNRLSFLHPIFQAYLTGKALNTNTTLVKQIINQAPWSAQTQSFAMLTATGSPDEVIDDLLSRDDPIMHQPTLTAGWLLRFFNPNHSPSCRNLIMSNLVKIFLDNDQPAGLRTQAMVLLCISGDKYITSLFRQSIMSESPILRTLSILGAGLMRDTKSVELILQTNTISTDNCRRAACLALVSIGSQQSLEAVAFYFLHGDDQLRMFAAQALANHPREGWEALQEGLHNEDILVRRAAVSGLSRINESWSTELLQQVQNNEKQWAVQNLATEMLQFRTNPKLRIPKKLPPAHENPWLIEYAGKFGMGISPGSPATDIFLLSLKDTKKELFHLSMQYLRKIPSDGVLSAIYPFLYVQDPEISEYVYETLTYMVMSGASLPDPRQFGLG